MTASERFWRFLRRLTIADRLFVLLVAILALPSLLGTFQVTPLEYRNIPFPVEQPVVRVGEPVVLRIERCNRTNDVLPYTVSRVLVNDTTKAKTQLADASSFVPPGCETIDSVLNIIPETVVPGPYHLEAVSIARVGSRVWNVPWTTDQFLVTR